MMTCSCYHALSRPDTGGTCESGMLNTYFWIFTTIGGAWSVFHYFRYIDTVFRDRYNYWFIINNYYCHLSYKYIIQESKISLSISLVVRVRHGHNINSLIGSFKWTWVLKSVLYLFFQYIVLSKHLRWQQRIAETA